MAERTDEQHAEKMKKKQAACPALNFRKPKRRKNEGHRGPTS